MAQLTLPSPNFATNSNKLQRKINYAYSDEFSIIKCPLYLSQYFYIVPSV